MKNKSIFLSAFVLLLSLGFVFESDVKASGEGHIPYSFYGSRYDRLIEYAPNVRTWGPIQENYYIQLGDTRPATWGPWYTRGYNAQWLMKKYNPMNLQRPRGRIILNRGFY